MDASYGDYAITMQLPHDIGTSRFLATPQDYALQLRIRREIPEGLKRLISELFRRGAITRCSITYGRRMDLALARTDASGHMLLSGPALEHFSRIFADITGEQISATWQAPGSGAVAGRGRRGSSVDSNALLCAVGAVVDAVGEGLQIAAAIKILTDD